MFSGLRLKCENVLISLSCLPGRETQGDGEESPEEEGPVSRSPSGAAAPTGSQEVTKEDAGCFSDVRGFQLFVLSGRSSITKATPL